MKINSFMTYELGRDWNYKIDEKGNVICDREWFGVEEVIGRIGVADKIERSSYGYTVFNNSMSGKIAMFIRFGNVTTRKNDTVERFVRENWDVWGEES